MTKRQFRLFLLMLAAFLAPASLIAKAISDDLAWVVMVAAITAWGVATVLFATRREP